MLNPQRATNIMVSTERLNSSSNTRGMARILHPIHPPRRHRPAKTEVRQCYVTVSHGESAWHHGERQTSSSNVRDTARILIMIIIIIMEICIAR